MLRMSMLDVLLRACVLRASSDQNSIYDRPVTKYMFSSVPERKQQRSQEGVSQHFLNCTDVLDIPFHL
jgi:hypothetical protein